MHHSKNNKKILFLLNSVALQAEYTLEKIEDRMLLCAVYSDTVINCTANKLRCVCSELLSKSPKSLICMTSLNEIQSITDGMDGFQI